MSNSYEYSVIHLFLYFLVEYNQSEVKNMYHCKNGQRVDPEHVCTFSKNQYGYISGCRDLTHLRSCGKTHRFNSSVYFSLFIPKMSIGDLAWLLCS